MSFDPLILKQREGALVLPCEARSAKRGRGTTRASAASEWWWRGFYKLCPRRESYHCSAAIADALAPQTGFYFCTPPPPRLARAPPPPPLLFPLLSRGGEGGLPSLPGANRDAGG